MKRKQVAALFFLLLCMGLGAAEDKLAKLAAALDLTGQTGVQLESFTKRVYNFSYDDDWEWYVYDCDDDDNPTYKDTNNSGWTVQEGNKYSTSPIKGDSCLRADLPTDPDKKSSNALEARLVFKVYGPGTFSFYYKTSCDSDSSSDFYCDGDGIYVYVDGEPYNVGAPMTGYGENSEYDWAYQDNNAEVTVEGNGYHTVMIVFAKDLPKTDWDGKYVPDGPQKPVKSDYDGDTESYNEDLAEYNALKALFFNTVWLDGVKWTTTPLSLEWRNDEKDIIDVNGNYIDVAYLIPSTNAFDMGSGYAVRYTLDGSNPTTNSPEFDEEDTFLTVMQSCTAKAAIFVNGKMDTSVGVVSKQVTIKAKTPVLAVDAAASTDTQIVLKPTEAVFASNTFVYTLDGTDPTADSTVGDPEMGIIVTDECTVKARCVREGITDSDVSSFTVRKLQSPIYRLLNQADQEEPNGVTTGDSLRLVVENPDPTLKYGSSADAITTPYTAPVTVNVGTSIYLRCAEEGCIPSEIVCVEVKKADMTVVWGQGDYALEVGWNLVSFPMALTRDSVQALVQRLRLFGFDAENRSYYHATNVEPGRAYLVFLASPEKAPNIELKGSQNVSAAAVQSGWNLLGLVKGQTSFSGKECWSYANGVYTLLPNGQKPSLWKGYMVKK